MSSNSNFRIYIDTEYAYPGMRKGTPRPTADDTRQIIQIAAIRWDIAGGKEVGSFDMLVLPTYLKTLPPFFTELTAITLEEVMSKGMPLNRALKLFKEFCKDDAIWTFDKDEEVFRQNCGYIDMSFPFKAHFIRVKPLLAKWGVDPAMYSSGTLYKAAGLLMKGHVHNALHDVRSMAMAVHTFEKRHRN